MKTYPSRSVTTVVTLVRYSLFCTSAVFLSSCATEQLRNSTVSVSSSATDIYYDQVLSNIAQQKKIPNSLPWAFELLSATIALNDTGGFTAGYAQTKTIVTPTAGINGSRVVQQSWGGVPVSNQLALLQLKSFYLAASQNVTIKNLSNTGVTSTTHTSVSTSTNSAGPTVVNTTTVSDTALSSKGIVPTNIGTDCFKFCRVGEAPANSYHQTYGDQTVFVMKDDSDAMDKFTRFTILIIGVIDQIPPKAPAGIPTIGTSQALPLLQ